MDELPDPLRALVALLEETRRYVEQLVGAGALSPWWWAAVPRPTPGDGTGGGPSPGTWVWGEPAGGGAQHVPATTLGATAMRPPPRSFGPYDSESFGAPPPPRLTVDPFRRSLWPTGAGGPSSLTGRAARALGTAQAQAGPVPPRPVPVERGWRTDDDWEYRRPSYPGGSQATESAWPSPPAYSFDLDHLHWPRRTS